MLLNYFLGDLFVSNFGGMWCRSPICVYKVFDVFVV